MTEQPHTQQQTGPSSEHDAHSRLGHGVKHRLTSLPWLTRAAGIVLSGVSLGFVVLFVFVLETEGDLTLLTRPLSMQVTLSLPFLVAALTLVTTAGSLLAWRYRYWSLPARIHHTLLVLLGLGFSWQLVTLGFLPI